MKRNSLRHQPKYKLKLIILLSALLAVLLFINTVVLSVVLRGSITREITENGNNTIAQLKSSVEQILSVMNDSMTQMALDTELQSFVDRMELLDIFDCEALYKRLYHFRATNKFIEKLYVYYYMDGLAIDLNGMDARLSPIEKLEDREFLELSALRCLELRNHKPFAVFNVAPENEDAVIVAAKAVPPMAAVPRTIIVVKVRQSYFRDMLSAISFDDDSNVSVLDEGGRFLFGKGSESPVFGSHGFEELESQRHVYVTTQSENTGWNFVYEIPRAQIDSQVLSITLPLWIITIAILLSALVGVWILAEGLYRPIRKVLKTIRGEDDLVPEKGDELSYIDESVRALMLEKSNAEQLIEENKPFLRNDLLYRLLSGDETADEELEERLRYFDVNYIKNARYCVAVLAPTRNGSDKELNAVLLLEMERINATVESYSGMAIEFIRRGRPDLVLLLSIDKSVANVQTVLAKLFNDISDALSAVKSIEVTIGVGGICDRLDLLSESYAQAKQAYGYRAIVGNNSIIFHSELPAFSGLAFFYPFKIERRIFGALRSGDLAGAQAAAKQLFGYVRTNIPPGYNLGYVSVQIFNGTLHFLSELSVDPEQVLSDLNSLYARLATLDTINALESYFADIFANICDYIDGRKRAARDSVSAGITAFLDENYYQDNICLELLAAKLHFSVSYLAREFRADTGKTIKEYLSEKRISRAKQLLGDPSAKIEDIARLVGYTNSRSFINAFKKHVGQTPGEYKNNITRGM